MKILIAGFQHETNTFAPSEADWDSFVEGGGMPGMVEGEALLDFKGINLPLGGFLNDLDGGGHEYLPVIWASASPSGKVTKDAFERIVGKITDVLKQNTPDAIYLDIHGAMVVEHIDDGEGELLKRVRELVGDEVPLSEVSICMRMSVKRCSSTRTHWWLTGPTRMWIWMKQEAVPQNYLN